MVERVKQHTSCRACGGPIIGVFDLGSHWPSEFPAERGVHARPRVPLNLIRCHSCGLIQLEHTVPPEWMFKEHYWYRSGINEAMVAALDDVCWAAIAAAPLSPRAAVLDIGANDGTLLSLYKKRLGMGTPLRAAYEPAPNMQSELQQHADVIVADFFPDSTKFLPAQFSVITSIACFYSNPDPAAFAGEVKRLLAPEGVWINQLAYLPKIISNSAFDGIAHEHVTYWSLAAMQHLLRRHALEVYDCEEVAVNEGSVRLFICHEGSREVSPRVEALLLAEEALHLRDTNEPYLKLRASAELIREGIASHIFETQAAGGEVDLLGASTKANTLLQWGGLYSPTIRRAIDRSPEKWGRFTVTGIPIVSEEEGRRDPAALLIVGPWAFRDQLLARERGRWPAGTRVLFPMPHMEVHEL
jgi:SAM-dependent methyltransferase